MKPKSKYNARKTVVRGIAFDSRKEADRYLDLLNQQTRGEIRDLRLQVEYPLILPYRDAKNGEKVPGLKYRADFTYDRRVAVDGVEAWASIVEDCKGYRTAEYVMKRKLMRDRYGIEVYET